MTPVPTGRVIQTSGGAELVIRRTFREMAEEVWKSLSISEYTARWIGPWSGEAGPGKTVRLVMSFEEGAPASDWLIEACEAPRLLKVTAKDEHGEWRLALSLNQTEDRTELTFVQQLSDPKLAGEVGPGWEYYLDMLVASREGAPRPKFSDYYPAQRPYYADQVR